MASHRYVKAPDSRVPLPLPLPIPTARRRRGGVWMFWLVVILAVGLYLFARAA